ncbi:hypothetical protein ADINL_0482 [Nitrincola lacisaponensis]|uniref:Uncharacterized protein n=1 Tax=Nitrincola lacisaponensis TaxID=267850 RepID=A0A063Y3E4_9GAMM|nr:hypothetical protein ADINL_0482 [Nitrincola lacisaponensis]
MLMLAPKSKPFFLSSIPLNAALSLALYPCNLAEPIMLIHMLLVNWK